MKKFILLFATATMCFSAAEAQKITKIFGRNTMDFPEVVNFETDTFQYVAQTSLHVGRHGVNAHFSILFENGDKLLKRGDTIVLDFKLGATSIFIDEDDNDSLHYILTNDLAANDTLRIDLTGRIPVNLASYFNSFIEIDEFRDEITLIATVYRTSNGIVSFNQNKQLTAYFLRYLRKPTPPYNTERTMQNIQIYPNPISSNLNITNLNNTKVEVFNVVGQQIIVHENANGSLHIDMTSYPNGVYFIKMQNGKSVRTEKIKLVK
jgi:hypothetical protein